MITLIGNDLAEEGLVFIFNGSAEVCESCRFKSSCIESLEEGRKYKIINVRDTEQKCQLHDGDSVKVVEVEKADIDALIDSKKVHLGASLTFTPPECNFDCIFNNLCFPEGLFSGDKCTFVKDLGKHEGDCAKGFILHKVTISY
ncbi:MAG: UPF0179 family protein [Methanobrevibacter sp.]|nr:UPF0179 family protein [Methanobrevibacter sp.]